MAIVYRIYSNGGTGGPIDYSTPLATTPDPTYTTAGLAPSRDYRFAVRAFDTATGIEEANTQATRRLVLDGLGRATGDAPKAIHALVARPLVGGNCRVSWAYRSAGQATPPISFEVYLTTGLHTDLGTPQTTVAYRPGALGYSCSLTGLSDGIVSTVSVLARGADALAACEAVSVGVRGDSTPPDDVDGLIAVAVN